MDDNLTHDRVEELTAQFGWTVVGRELQVLFDTGDFRTGLALVNRIGEVAEAAEHHPDILLTYPSVRVSLTSHDVGDLTQRDVDLALEISEIAGREGIGPAGE